MKKELTAQIRVFEEAKRVLLATTTTAELKGDFGKWVLPAVLESHDNKIKFLSWKVRNYHEKPCGLVSCKGCYKN